MRRSRASIMWSSARPTPSAPLRSMRGVSASACGSTARSPPGVRASSSSAAAISSSRWCTTSRPASGDGPDRLWGLSWRVPAIAEAHARLRGAGVEVSDIRTGRRPGTQVFTVKSHTAGVPTLLIGPHAADWRGASFGRRARVRTQEHIHLYAERHRACRPNALAAPSPTAVSPNAPASPSLMPRACLGTGGGQRTLAAMAAKRHS